MLSSIIHIEVRSASGVPDFDWSQLASSLAGGSSVQTIQVRNAAATGSFFSWEAVSLFTFGKAVWLPQLSSQTVTFRRAIGVIFLDSQSSQPQLLALTPLPIASRALFDIISRQLPILVSVENARRNRSTKGEVSINTIEISLASVLGKLPNDALIRDIEGETNGLRQTIHGTRTSGGISRSLPSLLTDILMLGIDWRHTHYLAVRPDFSIQMSEVNTSLESIADILLDFVSHVQATR
jgi:hypothetical protein